MLHPQIDQSIIIVIIGVLAAVLAVAIAMLVLEIDQAIIIALISVIGGVLPVGISYVSTKNKEIEASIRQQKTQRYDDLIDVLTMIVRDGFKKFASDPKLVDNFITTYHKASAYASDLVLKKCNTLLIEISKGANSGVLTPEGSDILIANINEIYMAIRKDINPKARYFRVNTLWIEPKEGPN